LRDDVAGRARRRILRRHRRVVVVEVDVLATDVAGRSDRVAVSIVVILRFAVLPLKKKSLCQTIFLILTRSVLNTTEIRSSAHLRSGLSHSEERRGERQSRVQASDKSTAKYPSHRVYRTECPPTSFYPRLDVHSRRW
jgi:hypothetical protein